MSADSLFLGHLGKRTGRGDNPHLG
jgi:hypothetical protein